MNKTVDNDKLDWMYKAANSQVDREEYLLGKSVDKSFEQLNNEEKEKKLGLVPPKNHVEHECIPPSIRDYNKIVQQEQVDLSAKLQEDPLVAIKKQEEDARRQFLQNPIQLKKLQEALKAQESKKKKKKRKKRKQSEDSEDSLDKKLSEKLKNLKGSSTGFGLLKKEKTKSKDDHLDTILMHKFNQLKDKLSQEDLDDILAGKSSDSEDESSKIKKQKKCRSSSNSSHESSEDQETVMRKPIKLQVGRNQSGNSKYGDHRDKTERSYSKDQRRNNSSNSNYNEKNNKKDKEGKYKNYDSRESTYKKKYVSNRRENDNKNKKHEYSRSRSSNSNSSDDRKKSKKDERSCSYSNKPNEDLDKMILEKLRMLRDSKTDRDTNKDNTDNLKAYSHYDSDNDEYVVKKKSFGLVRSDGTKIPLKNHIPEPKKIKKVEQPKPVDTKKNVKLTDKEKEELRKQMLIDAIKRDKERSDNLKKHRQENQLEESKIDNFDKNFVHRELSKSQSNIKDVETRIRSKLNNIQRSSQHMNSNFSKRS